MKANARGWDHTARYTELSQERSHLSGLAPNASTPLPAALDVEVDAYFVATGQKLAYVYFVLSGRYHRR
jgi:hypothetical protein